MALDFFAGCVGGCAGIVVGYPLDTIKVHMQTQDYRNPKYKGNWDCFRTLLAKESVAGLYRGMSSPLAGVALVNAVIFGVYGQTQKYIPDPASLTSYFAAGALAGIVQSPICSPIELAKTRMQLQASAARFSGPLQCLKHAYTREGYRGVFKGLNVTLLREAPSFGVYFLVYEALTKMPDNVPVSTPRMLLAGGLAGTASWVISYPLDVIKSRIQADGNRYAGLIDCVRQSVKTEGYSCLYRGLSSTIVRAFPTNAVTFTAVMWTFRLLGRENVETKKEEEQISMESIGESLDMREPFLEQWNNFLTSVSRRMATRGLPYSTLSMTSTDELKLEWSVQYKDNEKWTKEGVKCGEQTRGDKFGREEDEKPTTSKEDVENSKELVEKKVDRTVRR
ncbi:mitochondrial basic amino acids transporter-like isoform X1 [Bombus huntii]|uniref:mitochondrial basic amino acids transporter-like isoform X1 n=2 Tax=Bombus huntii TaxID=85661 RepID=UPI0021AAD774|nr:mitochondrial basic amino acids transporter-like isoform X1 [Bombus huntii]